jgi:hypothetical protein
MAREAMSNLVDRWFNDEAFRVDLRRNPEETIKQSGFELDNDEWEAVKSVDWSLPDEELQERINRSC